MAAKASPTRDEARTFYEDFALGVGLRDWLSPNARHEQLKLHIADLLRDRQRLKIVDVGCGAGVMTAHLRRYGDVTGVDFSAAAIEAARKLAPGVTFIAGLSSRSRPVTGSTSSLCSTSWSTFRKQSAPSS